LGLGEGEFSGIKKQHSNIAWLISFVQVGHTGRCDNEEDRKRYNRRGEKKVSFSNLEHQKKNNWEDKDRCSLYAEFKWKKRGIGVPVASRPSITLYVCATPSNISHSGKEKRVGEEVKGKQKEKVRQVGERGELVRGLTAETKGKWTGPKGIRLPRKETVKGGGGVAID